MELIDKKVKTTAIIIFPMIKSVEENMNILKIEMSKVENTLVEVAAD